MSKVGLLKCSWCFCSIFEMQWLHTMPEEMEKKSTDRFVVYGDVASLDRDIHLRIHRVQHGVEGM